MLHDVNSFRKFSRGGFLFQRDRLDEFAIFRKIKEGPIRYKKACWKNEKSHLLLLSGSAPSG